MIPLTCHCGKRHSVAPELAGQVIRCRRCGWALSVPFPETRELDASSTTVFEATKEPPRPERTHSSRDTAGNRKRLAFRAVSSSIGAKRSLLISLASISLLLMLFAIGFALRNEAKRLPSAHRIPKDQILAALEKAGAEGDIDTIKRLQVQIEEELIEELPKDAHTLAVLAEASMYYKEAKYIWHECLFAAAQLQERGLEADPREILRAFLDVMKRLNIAPRADQSPRTFRFIYLVFRESHNHRDAVDMMVARRKFANEVPDEIPVDPEPNTMAREDEPRYGAYILLALMNQANKRVRIGQSIREWLDRLTEEQRLAVLLQKATDPREFFHRGWADQVPYTAAVLRKHVGGRAAGVQERRCA